jgi:hypothetical protein
VPAAADGEVEVAVRTISLDPDIRLRIAGRHLTGKLSRWDAIVSEMVGQLTRSRAANLSEGATVAGFAPWSERAVLPVAALRRVDRTDLPASLALGMQGMPGLTGWAGAEMLRPGPDDTLVVSVPPGRQARPSASWRGRGGAGPSPSPAGRRSAPCAWIRPGLTPRSTTRPRTSARCCRTWAHLPAILTM